MVLYCFSVPDKDIEKVKRLGAKKHPKLNLWTCKSYLKKYFLEYVPLHEKYWESRKVKIEETKYRPGDY
jgi:hypothetical protein